MNIFEATLLGRRSWSPIGSSYEVTKKPRKLNVASLDAIPFAPMDSIPQGGAYHPEYIMKSPAEIKSGTYFERGDILVAKITPSFENGKQALTTDLPTPFGYATTEVIPLRPRTADHDPRLLFYYLLHPDVRRHVSERMEGATGRQRIPLDVLLDVEYPDFGLQEQTEVANLLETIQKVVDVENRAAKTAVALRRATMMSLFTYGINRGAQQETAIGKIPATWELTPCDAIFGLTSGTTRPAAISKEQNSETPYPVLGGNGVMGFAATWQLDAPLVLIIGRVGEYCGSIHIASGKMWVTDNALYANRWRNDGADLEFVGAFLSHYDLNRFKRTAGQPLVTQGTINEQSIPLPPSIEEQRQIVRVLKVVDAAIDIHRRKHSVLNSLFKGLLHKLITEEVMTNNLTSLPYRPSKAKSNPGEQDPLNHV